MTRTIKERLNEQNDELFSLQSIYGDSILFYKTQNCWKQPCPLEVTIRIKPQSNDVYVSLDMVIVCSKEYPDKAPAIFLKNLVELSMKDGEKLQALLEEKANESLGMAMIFDLCQVSQNFVSERNRKPAFSEHEIMLNMYAQKEMEKQKQRLDSENREVAEIAAENERRRVERLDRLECEGGDAEARKTHLRMLNFGELSECEMVEMLGAANFGSGEKRRIYKLSKFKATRPTVHKFATEWIAYDQTNQILVTEWTFEFTLGRKNQRKHSTGIDFSAFERKLELFVRLANQKLNVLKAEDQQFFASYLFVNLKRNASSPTNFNCKLLIGQSVESDDKCVAQPQVFETIKENSQKYAPQLAAQIVCALKWLHGQGFSHGYLLPYSVWMISKQIFRLSDYFLMPRLIELCQEFEHLTSGLSYTLPEDLPLKKRQGRDLFALGELLDSILCLEKVTPSDTGLVENGDMSHEEASDFIALCQSAKDVEELIDHNYLVHDLTRPSNDVSLQSSQLPKKMAILSSSRLTKDFQVYQYLGKGGFGDVFLARNKLDDNDYAIKRIPLNPKNDRLNQKIKREAKLFSKLNHEHVVRFYAAWLESIPIDNADDEVTSSSSEQPSLSPVSTGVFSPVKTRVIGNLKTLHEKSDESKDENSSLSSSSSSDNDFKGGKFFRKTKKISNRDCFEPSASTAPQNFETLFSQQTAFQSKSTAGHSEFDVVFCDDDEEEEEEGNLFKKKSPHTEEGDKSDIRKEVLSSPKFQQILYIQMEFCKNSTLRSFIDSGRLCGDASTIWRLFREVLSGLQYIHHQNMIHRDIKPMNIFLDSNCSVKIGDFGLATREFFGQNLEGVVEPDKAEKQIFGAEIQGGFTKDVGTAMYIAPETEGRFASKFYTSKIDVYSVGIVLFEMAHRPPVTASERFTILQNLRNEMKFPEDFASELTSHQRASAKKLIVWMMKANPIERPSVDTLLQSEIIPLVAYEDDEFQKLILQTLRNRNSRQYKRFMAALFNEQNISPVLNYCFDQTISLEEFRSQQRSVIMEQIKHELEGLFRMHAFVSISTHLLSCCEATVLQKELTATAVKATDDAESVADGCGDGNSRQQCTLIDCSGLRVSLPRNLRQNFIRYCARNGISKMKRFTFGKVFEHADLSGGVHPIERHECCVDMVGQAIQRHLIAAECVALSIELVRKVSIFDGLKWTLVLGHTKLIKAACVQLNISDQLTQNKVLNTFYHFSTRNKKMSAERKCEFLVNRCGLTSQLSNSLLHILETASDFSAFSEHLRSLTRSKWPPVRELARDALDEISKTLAALRYFCAGIKSENLSFNAGLCYRPQIFDDSFTYVLHVDIFHRGAFRAVAVLAGGSFESAIGTERRTAQDPTPPWPICAYGFNLAMEDLVQLYLLRNLDKIDVSSCNVLVCSTLEELVKAKYDMVQRLWDLGISADVSHEPLTSVYNILEHCEKNSIHILLVLLKSDEVVVYVDEIVSQLTANYINPQQQYAKRSTSTLLLGYRITQNKISYEDAIRFVLLAAVELACSRPFLSGGSGSNGHLLNILNSSGRGAFLSNVLSTLVGTAGSAANSSLINFGEIGSATIGSSATGISVGLDTSTNSLSNFANVNINFAMDDKPAHNTRKKIEIQIRNVLGSEFLPKLNARTRVEVFVTELSTEIVRELAAYLDRGYESVAHIAKAVDIFQAAHKVSGRHRSDLDTLVRALQPVLLKNGGRSAGGTDFSVCSFSRMGGDALGSGGTGTASSSVDIGSTALMTGDTAVIVLWCKQTTPTSNIFYKIVF